MKLMIAALSIFLLAAACAPTATQTAAAGGTKPASGRDCFNADLISGYGDVDRDTIRVSSGASREYDLDLQGPGCQDIKWTQSIAIVSRSSSWICVGDRVGAGDIKFRDTGNMTTSCMITDVRRYVKPAPAPKPAT